MRSLVICAGVADLDQLPQHPSCGMDHKDSCLVSPDSVSVSGLGILNVLPFHTFQYIGPKQLDQGSVNGKE